MRRNQNQTPTLSSVFDEFLNNSFFNNDFTDATMPAVNIKEGEKSYELEFAVPGLNKKDFNIDLNHNVLTVSYEKKNEEAKTEENYTRREYSYESFQRSFTLPEGKVNYDKIKANYKDGILKIELPKRDEVITKANQKIAIS